MGEGRMSLQLREIAAGVARFEKTSEPTIEPSAVTRVARESGELEIELPHQLGIPEAHPYSSLHGRAKESVKIALRDIHPVANSVTGSLLALIQERKLAKDAFVPRN